MRNLSYAASQEYLGRPLYVYDLDNEANDDEILNFITSHYKDFVEGDISAQRRYDQTDNFAAYLGFSEGSSPGMLTESGPVYNKRPSFKKLRTHPIKYLTDSLVSRFVRNKPNFQVYTVNKNLLEESKKVNTANKVCKSIFEGSENRAKFKEFVSHAVIFAESYLEVFWNINKGPRTGTKQVRLLDGNGEDIIGEDGKPTSLTRQLNLGDYDLKLWDPRFVITQAADTYDLSEWTILFKYVPVEKLRLEHPELAHKIKSTANLEDVEISTMNYREYKNHTIYFKLYHRPCTEMPNGRLIEATPDVVLRNTPIPHPSICDKELFPIVQLRSVKAIGSERGIKSIVSQGKGLQVAKNNLLSMTIRNLVSFPPIRVWGDRSVDADKLRHSIPTDVTIRSNGTPPQVITPHVVTNEVLELMRMIDDDLLKIFTVSPVSVGDSIPNIRSRQQMDFIAEKESQQTFPIEDDIRDSLIQIAQLVLTIVGDEYTTGKDQRMIRYFGKQNKLVQEPFEPEDLRELFDIRIDTAALLADTFQGKVNQISNLAQIVGTDIISKQWIVDKFNLGDADEVINVVSGGPELARKHIASILEGKEVKSPQKWLDLIPYYEEFLKKLQSPEILEILSETGYEGYLEKSRHPEKTLKGQDLIAFRLLDQVNATEALLLDAIQEQEGRGLVDPQSGVSLLRIQLLTKFPTFPTVYRPDSNLPINPLAEPAVPKAPTPEIPPNMGPVDQKM